MHRIDTTTKFTDLFGPGKAGFRDGNKVASIAATAINAAWCNSVQEELANAIEAHGVPLDPSLNAQLAAILVAKAPILSPGFEGVPTTPTPAQFDNSQKIVNTECMRRELGRFSGHYDFTNSANLLPSHIGGFISISGNTIGQTYSLLSVNAVISGAGHWLCNRSGQPAIIKADGAENIISPRSTGNAFVLNVGESCCIVCNQGANWNVGNLTLSIGVGQTNRDLSSARALNTLYTNSSLAPKTVSVAMTNTLQAHAIISITNPYTSETCEIVGSGSYSTYDQACFVSATIPPYHLYKAKSNTGSPSMIGWSELY